MKALNSCVTGMYGKDMLRIRIRAVTSWCGRIPAERMFCACARELLPNCDRIFKEKTVCALAWEPLPQVWQDPCRKNVLRMPKRALTSTVTGSLWKRQSAHWHENFYLRCDRIPVERMFCACTRELVLNCDRIFMERTFFAWPWEPLSQVWQDLCREDVLSMRKRALTSGVTESLRWGCSAHAHESSYLRCDRIPVERMFCACAWDLLLQVWQDPYGKDNLRMRMRTLISGVTGSLWRECSEPFTSGVTGSRSLTTDTMHLIVSFPSTSCTPDSVSLYINHGLSFKISGTQEKHIRNQFGRNLFLQPKQIYVNGIGKNILESTVVLI
jgi:hypothetical protein